jgi:proline iminopeptidase
VPADPPIDPAAHLYPSIEPYDTGVLDTGEGHNIYREQCGNPLGLPVVVLHGGPASGCSPLQRRLFDPTAFRIVLFDQRGCGRSTPRGLLAGNDTAALVRDIEQLRRELHIERWIVFGGSWGASLAIAYAAAHPAACLGVILRGTFLTGSRDLDWFFGGAGALLPTAWSDLVARIGLPLAIGECEHAGHAVLATLRRQLFCDSASVAGAAAAAWARWEDAVSRPGQGLPAVGENPPAAQAGFDSLPAGRGSPAPAPQSMLVDKYRVQAHYLENQCFLGEEVLLRHAARLSSMPVQLVHGRLDWVCRPTNAWQAHRAIAGSTLAWVDHGGHNPYDPPMLKALAEAIRRIQGSTAA